MADFDTKINAAVSALAATVADPKAKAAFEVEMQGFKKLVGRFVAEKAAKPKPLDWAQIKSLPKEKCITYEGLAACPQERVRALLDKLVVLKLNGGLGTTMGCVGPKSVIEVREGLTFLDLTVKQIEHLNSTYGTSVPLVLMNSFNTDSDTAKIIEKYADGAVRVMTFNQKRFPRIHRETLMPIAESLEDGKYNINEWYPPGHGDIYDSFVCSDVFARLKAEGKEYVFISNVDNLGATVDLGILNHLVENGVEFCSEVTNKTRADVKGGTLIEYEGSVRLLEIAQVQPDKVEEFKSIKKFKIFNTNNMWVNMKALEANLANLDLEIIANNKMYNGIPIVQLETAAGAAIRFFKNAAGLVVPRSRFLPVKSCSDLLLVQSNLYALEGGRLVMNPLRLDRMGAMTAPAIKLGPEFQKVGDYASRVKGVPDILELEHLTVVGDVKFGSGVSLRGTVIIVSRPGETFQVPDGTAIENKVISGPVAVDY